jgi:hypothetical protein
LIKLDRLYIKEQEKYLKKFLQPEVMDTSVVSEINLPNFIKLRCEVNMAKDSHPQSVAQRMLGLVEGDGRDDPALARDGRRTAPAQRLQVLNQCSFQYTVPYTSINSPGRKKIVLNAKTVARSPILRTPI